MPVVLRKIRKAKWYKHPDVPWLLEHELQADALFDLKTDDNEMSVWLIDDERSNLDQVIAALAAKTDFLSNFDYAFWDLQFLLDLNIKVVETEGDTEDTEANNVWHRDLCELSASKIMALAQAIVEREATSRFSPKKVGQLIVQAVSLGRLEQATLKPDLGAKIAKLLPAE